MTARRTQGRALRGLTLIEVMVAMVIIAIVSTLLYTGFVQTAHNKQRIENELDRYHEIRTGLDRIVRELSMAYVSAQVNPVPALQMVNTCFVGTDSGKGARIDFTSFSHLRLYRDAHESDQNELSYYIDQDPHDSDENALVRREQRRIDEDPRKGGQVEVLIENVKGFELGYLENLTGEWVTTWDTTQAAMQPNRLPTQVRIKLTVPNVRGQGPDQVFGTRVSLQMTLALNHAIYKR
jgi:general secretion pathway protein J